VSRRVRLRPEVPDDLVSIHDYLLEKNTAAANRFLDAIQSTLDDLAAFPGKGSPKQFRGAKLHGIRSWHIPGFRNYLILYRPIAEGIDVIAIVHGARNLRRLLNERKP
jgi:toxin ParE1/3/4